MVIAKCQNDNVLREKMLFFSLCKWLILMKEVMCDESKLVCEEDCFAMWDSICKDYTHSNHYEKSLVFFTNEYIIKNNEIECISQIWYQKFNSW